MCKEKNPGELVFVYGSLMKGLHNNRVLGGAEFLGEDATEGNFVLLDLGSFPGAVVEGEGCPIKGEVYKVGRATMARLDRLEGNGHFYQRYRMGLASGRRAWIYFLIENRNCPIVEGGDWRSHVRKNKPSYPLAGRLAE